MNPVRTGSASRARHIGDQATLQLAWSPTPHVALSATASYFRAGLFLHETPAGKDVSFFTAWAAYRF